MHTSTITMHNYNARFDFACEQGCGLLPNPIKEEKKEPASGFLVSSRVYESMTVKVTGGNLK